MRRRQMLVDLIVIHIHIHNREQHIKVTHSKVSLVKNVLKRVES